jgi:hypothetical protein
MLIKFFSLFNFAALTIDMLRFQFFTAAGMKMAVFWDVDTCSLSASTSETSVNFYQTARHNDPKNSRL